MKSSSDFYMKRIKPKFISVHSYFYDLTDEQLFELVNEIIKFINDVLNDRFIMLFTDINGKVIKDFDDNFKKKVLKNKYLYFNGMADLINDIVYNKTTLRNYLRKLERYWFTRQDYLYEQDYVKHYKECLEPYLNNKTKLKEALLSSFNIDYTPTDFCSFDDFEIDFSARINPDISKEGFSGDFTIRFFYECFSEEMERLQKIINDFSICVSEKTDRINIVVGMVNASNDRYEFFFRDHLDNLEFDVEIRNRLSKKIKYRYMTGIGWMNIISPKVAEKVSIDENTVNENSKISITRLNNNALVIKSKKNIEQINANDLKEIKSVMYDCLVPSNNWIDNGYIENFCSSTGFEKIPVFDDELILTDDKFGIVTRHKVDIDYLMQEWD